MCFLARKTSSAGTLKRFHEVLPGVPGGGSFSMDGYDGQCLILQDTLAPGGDGSVVAFGCLYLHMQVHSIYPLCGIGPMIQLLLSTLSPALDRYNKQDSPEYPTRGVDSSM